ncbi:MAG: hypothetical protein A2W25_04255 [candidate division Zixibacteria bacterium RBG_16_53_22]|nr:MAG: hypothetical protein A2W25_04255 [candidate division Zixibacteria bacterium RBG_16_53_22]
MERKSDDKGIRWYTIAGGAQLPSVTSILHNFLPEPPALAAWKARPTATADLKFAATLGTIAHYRIATIFAEAFHLPMVDLELDKDAPPLDYDLINGVKMAMVAFAKMMQKHELIPHIIEHSTWHQEMMYAGTVDFLGDLDGVPSLIDFKTSPQVRDSHRAQVVAYKRAVLSHPDARFKPQQAVVIVVSPVNGFKVEVVKDEDAAWDLFWTAFDNFQKAHRPKDRWCNR